MNYLAHFHLAGCDDGFVVGALLGDFIKGPLEPGRLQQQVDLSLLPGETVAGIQLHREIDSYFDEQAKQLFAGTSADLTAPATFQQGQNRRYLPIVLDLFFDHALSHHWEKHSLLALEKFSEQVLAILKPSLAALPDDAQNLVSRLDQYELLTRYGEEVLMRQIAEAIAARFSKSNNFMGCYDQVMAEKNFFEDYFFIIYPQLQRYAEKRINQLTGSDA